MKETENMPSNFTKEKESGQMQKKNHIFLQLKKITEVTTLSFLLFYILFPGISTNLYLGIYAAAILILYFAAGDYRNTEILQEFLTAGVFATIGFLISKLANGCTVADIGNNKSLFRFLLLEACIAEYIIFWLLQMKSQKEQQRFYETSASMKLFQLVKVTWSGFPSIYLR